jgi:uncharacterized protein
MSLMLAIATVAVSYLLLCFGLWRWQRRFIFYPTRSVHRYPTDLGVPCHSLRIPVAGVAEFLDAWWLPAEQPNARSLLYFHGNGDNISIGHYADRAVLLRNLRLSVLLIDYRGYGQSDGLFPTEATVYHDAECAWRYLTEQLKATARQTYIYGHSLGGAIAIELATHHPEAAGLIVEGSFTSIRDMARYGGIFRIFPLRRLIHQRFDSISKLPLLKMPLLFVHGTRDWTVPCRMSRELFAAAPEPKQLLIVPGGHHLDNATVGGQAYLDTLRNFVNRRLPVEVDNGR